MKRLGLLLAVAACDQSVPPPHSPPPMPELPARHPPIDGASQMPSGHPPAEVSLQMPAGHPPMGGSPMPSGHPTDAAPGEVVLRGTIVIAPGIAAQRPPKATLFITARPAAQGTMGPPALVKRVDAATFPVSFELSTANLMMPGMPVPPEMTVTVRLDQDGDAISRLPGDLSGSTAGPVKKGDTVVVTLATVETEFKPGRRIQ